MLFTRDYGLYDMAQLRFPGAQLLGDCLYRRRCAQRLLLLHARQHSKRRWQAEASRVLTADDAGLEHGQPFRRCFPRMSQPQCPLPRSEGTLAYFFSTQAMSGLAEAAGFETVDCEYARVQVRGRLFLGWVALDSRTEVAVTAGMEHTLHGKSCLCIVPSPVPFPLASKRKPTSAICTRFVSCSCATARTGRPCGACLCTACSASLWTHGLLLPAQLPSVRPSWLSCCSALDSF